MTKGMEKRGNALVKRVYKREALVNKRRKGERRE